VEENILRETVVNYIAKVVLVRCEIQENIVLKLKGIRLKTESIPGGNLINFLHQ
jgi:hypothetical protein